MVRIRLKRMGRRHKPFFRICAVDQREERDGRMIEDLGTYDPGLDEDKKVIIKKERVEYWLSVGAQPSETVASLCRNAGIQVPKKNKNAKKKAKKKAKASADK